MWKHLIIVCLGLGLARLYHLDLTPYQQNLANFLHGLPLLTYTSILALTLISGTLFVKNPQVLGGIRLLVSTVLEISLFIISFISLYSIYWAIWEDGNLWKDFQPLLPVPVIFILTAILCTNMIDFNQPVIRDLIPYLILAASSFLIINLGLL